MTLFLVLAGVLALVAAAVVAVPLLWRAGAEAPARPFVALGLSVFVMGGAAALYAHWSNWSWAPVSDGFTPEAMVGRLARKLEKQPDDIQGWLLLGRSYAVMEQYPLAQRAYQRADRLSEGKSVEALVGLGEAMALASEQALDGPAAAVFEQALALDPQSGKALFYGAVAATRREDLPLARDRFKALLALNPPENVRALIERQVGAIEATLAAGQGQDRDQTRTGPAAGAGPATTVAVNVSITPAMQKLAKAGAALFVLVRDPKQPGPPLAAKRVEAKFPLRIQLAPSDAMIAGHSFSVGQQVEVVARVANGGTPTAQSGDPVGRIAHKVGDSTVREILIDQATP
ncbi:MAG: hypothetical protein ABIT36_00735 [Steroidobacteraceae bacterium]